LEKHLHILCLDIPYPVDYGGVFDLFYKIKALKECGVHIHLHCFEYGRPRQPELDKYCVEVHYYPRQKGHKGFSHKLPFIVASRINEELYTRLLNDNYPILIEGIHCSYLLHDERFRGRKIFLRLHNVEYEYYRQLAKSTHSPLKKIYYLHESRLLKQYEKSVAQKAILLPVSSQDAATYQQEFGPVKCMQLPVFVPFHEIKSQGGIGCFCLYHGNLSVAENEKAAKWLLKEVFNDINIPFVVAGKNPSKQLLHAAHKKPNTCLVANPSETEMQDMIGKAQINIIPSFNNTGIKLKLLNVLYNGRHCITNEATLTGSGLDAACHVGTHAQAMKSLVLQLYNRPFEEEEIILRKKLLEDTYDNIANAKRLVTWIW
jgi:hypothetical protein